MTIENGAKVLCIDGRRDGYSPTQLGETMTAGELIELLSEYDEDTPVMLRNDNGYTYGEITWSSVQCGRYDEDSEDVEGIEDGWC